MTRFLFFKITCLLILLSMVEMSAQTKAPEPSPNYVWTFSIYGKEYNLLTNTYVMHKVMWEKNKETLNSSILSEKGSYVFLQPKSIFEVPPILEDDWENMTFTPAKGYPAARNRRTKRIIQLTGVVFVQVKEGEDIIAVSEEIKEKLLVPTQFASYKARWALLLPPTISHMKELYEVLKSDKRIYTVNINFRKNFK